MERFGVGNAIPSERQLSVDLGVSRLTVRAALDELVREGYLDRRRGSGTFVREPKIAQELTMTSFSEDMRQRGMRPGEQDALAHRHHRRRVSRPLPARLPVGADRRRQAAPARGRRDDGDRDPARARVARARADADRPRGALVLRAARRAVRDRDRRRHPDDRADRDERGGVDRARRAAPLARLPVRADDALGDRRDRRVRALDLPRRPLPARHRAEPPRARRARCPCSCCATPADERAPGRRSPRPARCS